MAEALEADLAQARADLAVLQAANAPGDALQALQGRAAVLKQHRQVLPRRTFEAALRAAPAGVLLAPDPELDPGQEPCLTAPGADWVHLAAFARTAGVGALRVVSKQREERDANVQRSTNNAWAKEAAGRLDGARRLKKVGKDRTGAWAAPLGDLLAVYALA